MPEDVAVAAIDVSADTGGDFEAPDVSRETSLDAEPSAVESDGGVEGEVDATPPGKLIVDGKLTPSAKAALDALKADPKNAKVVESLRRDAFLADRLRRELPGGVRELQELRSTIQEIGGKDGIQEIQGELNGWRGFDEQWTAGDPKVLEFMTETPEGMQAFLKIVPMAMEKYRDAHPEGFASYVSQVFKADMEQCGIPLLIDRLGDFLGDNPKAVELYQQLAAYVKQRIPGFASKQVALPKIEGKTTEADPDRAKFDQERKEFTRNAWGQDAKTSHNKIFNEAWQKHVGTRQLTPAQQQGVLKLYKSELQELLDRKKDFKPTLDKFLNSNQKDGFLRYFGSTYQESSPMALRKALAAFGITKNVAKPAVAATAVPKIPTGKPADNFIPVGQKPATNEIDLKRTTITMRLKNQAILRNGKMVSWK